MRVQNLERLRQVGQFVMRAQKAVAQAMERANPHATHVQGQHAGQAGHHLLGGLVGERHGQNATGRHLSGLQQPGNARGQHPGFAGTGSGQDQRVLCGQHHGGELLGVEVVQQACIGRTGKGGGGKHKGHCRKPPG